MKHIISLTALMMVFSALMLFNGCDEDEPVPLPSTIAGFEYEASNDMVAPTTVKFTNKSILATSYQWDFGNGQTSTEAEPEVTFNEPGNYTVSLSVEPTHDLHYNQLEKQVAMQVKDPNAGKVKTLYFTDRTTHCVRYVVLDGNPPVVNNFGHTALDKPYGMAIDTANARVIVSDYREGVIYSYDLEGFDLQIVIDINNPVLYDPFGLEIIDDKLYWGTEGEIGRCNMDGTEAEVFITMSTSSKPEMAIDIAWDYLSGNFIFSNDKYEFSGGMYSVNFEGTTFTELVPETNGGAIALDVENNKMYYADMDKGICMANLDGSNEVVIAPEMTDIYCWGMAIDHDAGKIYWSNKTNGVIIRANLDGSEKEEFITDCNPYAIAIDTYR